MNSKLLETSYLIHKPVNITQTEDKVISELLSGPYFPWYWQEKQTLNNDETVKLALPAELRETIQFYNGPLMAHSLIYRAENENIKYTERPDKDISPYCGLFMEIFHRFTVENNIKYTNIFRAALNLTWHTGNLHTAPHVDHTWSHKNFIMYLTDCEDSETIIWSSNFLESYYIPCIKYTAAAFDQQWHAHRYPPLKTRRMVLVVTYI